MELLKDYDYTILYHPGEANAAVNVLSRKFMGAFAHITTVRRPLVKEFQELMGSGVQFEIKDSSLSLAHVHLHSTLVDSIKRTQGQYHRLARLMEEVRKGKISEFYMDSEGVLRCGSLLCVPEVEDLQRKVLEEAHHSAYTIHPGSSKIYHDMRELY